MRPIHLLALLACAACAGRRTAAPAAPAADSPAPVQPAQQRDAIHVDTVTPICVLRDGRPEMVGTRYDVRTGDTTYYGVPFSQAFPLSQGYAAQAEWYVTNESIPFGRRRYVKFGNTRLLGEREVVRVGEHRGVGLFVETGRTRDPQVLYVPVRPGCEFQPYMINTR